MKTLFNYIAEARETTETIQIKEGKNFINSDAKYLIFSGNVKYAEVYVQKDSYVESIDFSGITAQDLYFCAEQCNKLKSIVGGEGERIQVRIRKNTRLESVDISKYNSFGNDAQPGQATYIDSNKILKLSDKDLPKMVTDKHGLEINAGVKYLRSNGMTGKNKLQENK